MATGMTGVAGLDDVFTVFLLLHADMPLYPLFFLPHFTPNWHLHNAFSMGVLKHFSGGVVSGPIIGFIAVHSSHDVAWRPPTRKCQRG